MHRNDGDDTLLMIKKTRMYGNKRNSQRKLPVLSIKDVVRSDANDVSRRSWDVWRARRESKWLGKLAPERSRGCHDKQSTEVAKVGAGRKQIG